MSKVYRRCRLLTVYYFLLNIWLTFVLYRVKIVFHVYSQILSDLVCRSLVSIVARANQRK